MVKVKGVSAVPQRAIRPTDMDRRETDNGPDMEKDTKVTKTGGTVSGIQPENEGQSSISIGEQHLIEVIEKANKDLRGADKRFEFSIHEGTKEIMVKVIDDETGDIIREIPPEKILDMVAKMWELAGLLVDRKI